nr:zinc finger, CCHC-type [Tanacetum cinerariifolium]
MGGGEYYDPVYFQSTGIIHQTTAPYTPQENGVAERKNRTLKEMVNSMLSYYGRSEGFWGEVMLTACFILNRTLNKNSKQTPYEIWTKKVPNLTYLEIWGCRAVVRLTEPKMKNLGEKGIGCIFIGYAEHSKCYKFYVIEPNDYVSVNSIIESRDVIFDEERFTSIPRQRGMIQPSSSKISEYEVEGNDDVPYPSVPRKSTRTRKTKSFGSDFQLYFVEGTRDKTLSQQCKWILKRKMKVNGSIDKYKARLVIQCFRQNEGIDFFHTYAPVARISTIRLLLALAAIHDLVIHQMDVKTAFLNGTPVSQLEYSRAIGCLMDAMINTRPDIAFTVRKLNRYTSNPSALHWQALGRVFQYLKGTRDYGLTYSGYPSIIEGYSDASWINNMEDHSSTSGWVFLLEGCAISWVSKKQTCITSSTMESEFVALATAGNEAEWLRNLIYEIPLWPKPISTISIRCDSATTLAKAYSQVYNGKSRHLGVRHSMIRELIINGVIYVKFVRTQLNLADHLTKGLARDLVRKAAIGMGLKST